MKMYQINNKKELKRLFNFIEENYDNKFDSLKNEIMDEYVKSIDCEYVSWDSIDYGISTYIKKYIITECLDHIDISDWEPKWLTEFKNEQKRIDEFFNLKTPIKN